MTQSPTGLGQHLDRETDHRAGDPEARAGGAELGQHIWERYGDSPGVISMTAVLGLANHINRLSTGRLPLLADIQRRLMPADRSLTPGSAALPYAHPPVVAPVRFSSTHPASPVSETSPAFGGTGSLPATVAPAGVQRETLVLPAEDARRPSPTIGEARLRTVSEGSGKAQTASFPTTGNPGAATLQRDSGSLTGQAVQRKVTLPEPTRVTRRVPTDIGQNVGPPPSPGKGAPSSQRVARAAPRWTEAETASPLATSASHLGAAILQRHLDGPTGRVVQGKGTVPEPMHPNRRIAADTRSRAETASPIVTSASPLGAASLQRHLDGPTGRIVQGKGTMPEPMRPDNRLAADTQPEAESSNSLGEGAPRPQPVARGTPGSTGAEMTSPAPASASNLGTAILQRHLGGPVGRAVQRVQRMSTAYYGRSSRTVQGAVPHGQMNFYGIQMASLSLTRVGDPGTSIVQRYPGTRAGTHEASQETLAMPQVRGQAQRQQAWDKVSPDDGTEAMESVRWPWGGAVPSDIRGPQQVPKDTFASTDPTGLAVPPAIQRVVSSPATHSGRTPGATGPGVGRSTEAERSGGMPLVRRSEVPPMSAAALVAGVAGTSGTTLIQTRRDRFSLPPAMPLQRVTAESPATGPAAESAGTVPSPPTGEPSPSGEPTPGPEGLDLERLADEVYAILEQRLTVERESLGL